MGLSFPVRSAGAGIRMRNNGQTCSQKAAAVSEKDPLTYEQRRKYDYYFLEALRMKHKAIMMRPLNFTSIVWTFILSRQRPVMK